MKFHWGWGIAIVYGLFVLAFIIVLFISLRQDNSLVTENYYDTDLAYQEHKDKVAHYQALPVKLSTKYLDAEKAYEITYPAGMTDARGSILFYRPSSARMDLTFAIHVDSSLVQKVPVPLLASGRWTVQMEWTSGGEDYFREETLIIP